MPEKDTGTTALDVAYSFVDLALQQNRDFTMSPYKLHFLCYQAQGWMLAWTGSELFSDPIVAGPEGVLVESLDVLLSPHFELHQEVTFDEMVAAGIFGAVLHTLSAVEQKAP